MKKRTKHNLSHYRLATADMGKLVPVGLMEVLPGDTFQHSTDGVIRCAPMNAPVMHPTQVRIHHFFVPHRIVWDGWEDFITGEDTVTQIPTVTCDGDQDSALHYLGCPPVVGAEVSALPIRAYNKIWNEFYRDQDLQVVRAEQSQGLASVSWEKDYFTTARPWTAKGDEVTLPLGDTAPVVAFGDKKPIFNTADGTIPNKLYRGGFNEHNDVRIDNAPDQAGMQELQWSQTKLEADLSSATALNVNDVRRAFALQRYQEARAQYGSRYTEYLRYLGVTSSDARLQRPEYLGGGISRLNFSEILQTAESSDPAEAGVGDLYGHGIAGVSSNGYRKFFEEHGYVVTLMSVRPKSVYMNGIPRTWLRQTKEDFYQKELELIGQQEVLQGELSLNATNAYDVFGYSDRYSDYRSVPSQVSAEFRTVLDFWHMARNLPDTVSLNNGFIQCQPSDRIFQVQTNHKLWCMFNHNVVARRLVGKKTIGRVI